MAPEISSAIRPQKDNHLLSDQAILLIFNDEHAGALPGASHPARLTDLRVHCGKKRNRGSAMFLPIGVLMREFSHAPLRCGSERQSPWREC